MAQSSTVTPNALARDLSRALHRDVTPKAVRTVARDVLSRFDKTRHPEYQAHAYSAAEVRTLRDAFSKRGTRTAPKPAPKPRKAAAPKRKATAPVVTSGGDA